MKAERTETETATEVKGIWQRIKKPLLIAFFVLLVVISYCMYAQNAGIFPGSLLNRFSVVSYLKEQYPGASFRVSSGVYDSVRGRYVYDCTGDDGAFTMAAKNFSVREDGYYRTYLCDEALSAAAGAVIEQALLQRWETLSGSISVEPDIAIPLSENSNGAQPEALLLKYGADLRLTVTISGEKLAYEEYTEQVWQVIRTVRETLPDVRINFLQVFYRRSEAGNLEGVLQYESHMEGYSLMYTESGLKNAKNVHYYVELTEEQKSDLKWYSVIRIVNFAVIGCTVIGLCTLWIVRYRKKKKRYSNKNI